MKYTLRSLMIGVTLFCVFFGGRVEYLRRWAAFHEQKRDAVRDATFSGARIESDYHDFMANKYRSAMWRPWSIVDAPPRHVESL